MSGTGKYRLSFVRKDNQSSWRVVIAQTDLKEDSSLLVKFDEAIELLKKDIREIARDDVA